MLKKSILVVQVVIQNIKAYDGSFVPSPSRRMMVTTRWKDDYPFKRFMELQNADSLIQDYGNRNSFPRLNDNRNKNNLQPTFASSYSRRI